MFQPLQPAQSAAHVAAEPRPSFVVDAWPQAATLHALAMQHVMPGAIRVDPPGHQPVAVHRLEEDESSIPVERIAGDMVRRLRQQVTTTVGIETHEPP